MFTFCRRAGTRERERARARAEIERETDLVEEQERWNPFFGRLYRIARPNRPCRVVSRGGRIFHRLGGTSRRREDSTRSAVFARVGAFFRPARTSGRRVSPSSRTTEIIEIKL